MALKMGYLSTLENSMQAKMPPGLRTLYASFRAAGILEKLRIPKQTVYKSRELSAIVFGRTSAFASRKESEDWCEAGRDRERCLPTASTTR